MILALIGGFLLIISSVGYLVSVLLFALIPARSETSGEPSITFLYWAYVFPSMCCGTVRDSRARYSFSWFCPGSAVLSRVGIF